jgi:hypothetical protein
MKIFKWFWPAVAEAQSSAAPLQVEEVATLADVPPVDDSAAVAEALRLQNKYNRDPPNEGSYQAARPRHANA